MRLRQEIQTVPRAAGLAATAGPAGCSPADKKRLFFSDLRVRLDASRGAGAAPQPRRARAARSGRGRQSRGAGPKPCSSRSSASTSSPAMRRSSLNHSPRSIRRQRREQNGRNGDDAFHATGSAQCGQDTTVTAVLSGSRGGTMGRSAAGEREVNVFGGLRRSTLHAAPVMKAHGKAMLAAADLGEQHAAGRHADAQ